MQRLHEANEQFHHAGARLADADQMGFAERRVVADAIRAAERELEDVEQKIRELLSGDRPAAS
jgi:dephospho-CoA kinase